MPKIAGKLIRTASRVIDTARAVRQLWRDGGICHVQIAQVNHGEILAGKSILVTGGNSGIGLAIAKKCLAEGATVVITGRSESKLQAAAAQIEHSRLKILQWDVSQIAERERKLCEAATLAGGQIDILVNNAGIHSPESFLEVTEEDWGCVHSINLKGLFFLSQAFAKYCIKSSRPGKILNIASHGGILGASGPYRTSKWGVVGLTRGLGVKLAAHRIIVNCIAPGMTATPMIGLDSQKNSYANGYAPSNRVALPEEIAELAVFIMSDAANFIVGQTIVCDGGYSLKI
jgi:NAD(P)-dependent dehydrogenase (short-subunit alcohol dehydrogenase family)